MRGREEERRAPGERTARSSSAASLAGETGRISSGLSRYASKTEEGCRKGRSLELGSIRSLKSRKAASLGREQTRESGKRRCETGRARRCREELTVPAG